MAPKSAKSSNTITNTNTEKEKEKEKDRPTYSALLVTDHFPGPGAASLGPLRFYARARARASSSSSNSPECLLPIADRLEIEYAIEWLVGGGVEEIFVACSRGADAVELWFRWVRDPTKVGVVLGLEGNQRDVESVSLICLRRDWTVFRLEGLDRYQGEATSDPPPPPPPPSPPPAHRATRLSNHPKQHSSH